jgi:sugar-specific transcriptional regulator TrmB
MKRSLLSAVLIFAISLIFTSCRDNKKADSAEEVFERTENAIDDAAKATEGALEQAGKTLDDAVDASNEAIKATGDAIENAGEAVNKKVDEIRKD